MLRTVPPWALGSEFRLYRSRTTRTSDGFSTQFCSLVCSSLLTKGLHADSFCLRLFVFAFFPIASPVIHDLSNFACSHRRYHHGTSCPHSTCSTPSRRMSTIRTPPSLQSSSYRSSSMRTGKSISRRRRRWRRCSSLGEQVVQPVKKSSAWHRN